MDIQKIQQYKSAFDLANRVMESCKALKINANDHFREVTKMVQLGSGIPPAGDIKKVERRVAKDEKNMQKDTPKLPK